MSIIQRILGSLEARLSQPHLSIWRTIYVNLRLLPFRQAKYLPIFIYGKHRIFMLHGHAIINGEIKTGMIKIGVNGDSFSLFDKSGYIQLANQHSFIEFNGPCRIALNTKIRVVSGKLILGYNCRIGSNCRIICNGADISIGKYTGITFNCQIMNSGFHYMYSMQKRAYINRSNDIKIGAFNWIGNHTFINGNTITPDYTIVAQNSLLNKDFEGAGISEYSLLAGTPAKLVKSEIKRVFSPDTELKVQALFNDCPQKKYVTSEELHDNFETLEREM